MVQKVGLRVRDRNTKGAGRQGESRINSDISHESLLWKFHSLLAGIHGTRPCGSQHPSAGGSTGLHGEVSRHFSSRAPGYLHLTHQFRQGWLTGQFFWKRQPVQHTEVKGPAMAGHTGSPPSKQLLRCVKQLELQKTFS
ncbi:hypothetical protein AVEN_264259-1, partial [Araneus ventricosus]